MRGTSVDIGNEFLEIAMEVEHLARALERLTDTGVNKDSQAAWEACHICASATEKIYTGCERVMARLATDIDGAPMAHADGWHLALLRRMAQPFPNRRGSVISADCYRQLDRLRAFRHRERNTYGISLDGDIVLDRAQEAVVAFEMFRSEIQLFLKGDDLTPGS